MRYLSAFLPPVPMRKNSECAEYCRDQETDLPIGLSIGGVIDQPVFLTKFDLILMVTDRTVRVIMGEMTYWQCTVWLRTLVSMQENGALALGNRPRKRKIFHG